MKILVTQKHLDKARENVKLNPLSTGYTCICLVAEAINDAVAPRRVGGLGSFAGWFKDNERFELDDKGTELINTFYDKSGREQMSFPVPIEIEITLKNEYI